MPKIFISYGRDESYGQNLATEAQQQLQSAGFEVFRDVIGLKPGDVWYNKLEFELETSNLVVLVISERIRKSEWVHNEISLAKEIGLPIIPVIAEQVRMPLWLRHLQTLDFSERENWPGLVRAVCEHLCLPDKTETKKQNKAQEGVISISANSSNVGYIEEVDPDLIIDKSPKPVISKDGATPAPPGPFRVDCDPTDSCDEKSMHSVTTRAREAYWNNRLDESAELYVTLIELEPTVIDHKGELGNVLWRQGFPMKAAELYADIAVPMIKKGNGERVSNMVGFIGLFFPDRAADIRERLATGQLKSSG